MLAASIALFYAPHNLVTGGVSGLGIILLYYSSNYWNFYIPVWLTNLAINIPLLLLALKMMGIHFIAKTVFATLFLSLSLFFLENMPLEIESDIFLGAVFGGVVAGVGLGVVIRNTATTGGSDMAAMLVSRIKKTISFSTSLMFIDWAIIISGFFVFGPENTMYAIISIFVCVKAIDFVVEGLHFAKAAFVISDKSEEIGQSLMTQMNRGATSLEGKGLYTGNSKNVLLCVVAKKEISLFKELVTNVDKDAFVILTDVREVLGEGFKQS